MKIKRGDRVMLTGNSKVIDFSLDGSKALLEWREYSSVFIPIEWLRKSERSNNGLQNQEAKAKGV